MADDSPTTTRPRHFPEDLRAIIAEALPKIGAELDSLRHLVANGSLEVLQEIGELKFSFESFKGRVEESMLSNDDGHSKTQQMLSQLLADRDTDRQDFDSFQRSTNVAIAEIRRKIGRTNGSSNGAHY